MIYSTARQMKKLDDLVVENGLEIRQMMELAGWRMIQVLSSLDLKSPMSVSIVVGKGNKGGDGVACARHLANYGYSVSIILSTRKVSDDSQHHLDMAELMGIRILDWGDEARKDLSKSQIIIDALIGYQLSGAPRGIMSEIITFINTLNSKSIIAYDLPTGVDATTGESFSPSITADATLTLALPKQAQSVASHKFGRIFLGDIGIPVFLYDKIEKNSKPRFVNGLIEII